jgi:hypothetical protein
MFYSDPRLGMVQGDLHKADDEDGSWITMNGTHVHLKDGEVDKGPQKVKDHVAGKNAEKAKSAELDRTMNVFRAFQQRQDKLTGKLPDREALNRSLPKLQGSEKQVAWGSKIREGIVEQTKSLREKVSAITPKTPEQSAMKDSLVAALKTVETETKAQSWINARDYATSRPDRNYIADESKVRELVQYVARNPGYLGFGAK